MQTARKLSWFTMFTLFTEFIKFLNLNNPGNHANCVNQVNFFLFMTVPAIAFGKRTVSYFLQQAGHLGNMRFMAAKAMFDLFKRHQVYLRHFIRIDSMTFNA